MAAMSSKSLRLLLAGLLMGLGLAIWLSSNKAKETPGEKNGSAATETATRANRAARSSPTERLKPTRSISSAASSPASDEVADLIGDEAMPDNEVIDQLREIVASADRPLAQRTEALEHLILLVENDQPAALYELATMPDLPSELVTRISDESLNRPKQVRGEILLRLLEHVSGDARAEVLDELRFLTDADQDPADWRAAVEASVSETDEP